MKQYNLCGIGAGPSNLSIAAMLKKPETALFIEQMENYDWHSGLQLGFAELQVSHLKDLVTLADPTNKFSFLNYLVKSGRMYHFLNCQFENISRREYSDYLKWVHSSLNNINMAESVLSVDYENGQFQIDTSKDRYFSKHLSIGVGKTPYIPEFARHEINENNFHASTYGLRRDNFKGKKVVVIGGGQTGAEIVYDILNRSEAFQASSLHWVSRRHNFLPMDDSSFTNDLYMPCQLDYLADLDEETKVDLYNQNILSSDGISEKLIKAIYQSLYKNEFLYPGKTKTRLIPNVNVNSLLRSGTNKFSVGVKHNLHRTSEKFDCDIIIWATGYKSKSHQFLSNRIKDSLQYEAGEVRLNQDYSAKWEEEDNNKIFILNSSPIQKGLADPNLSLTAWRSKLIAGTIEQGMHDKNETSKSIIEWKRSSSPLYA